MTPIPFVDESQIIDLIKAPTTLARRWDEHAACAALCDGYDTYFPDEGAPPVEALARCMACPVAMDCLATAFVYEATDGYRNGWWGGFGPAEREELALRLGLSTETPRTDESEPANFARRLRAQNYTVPAIAAELGCTERTVYRYLAKSAA